MNDQPSLKQFLDEMSSYADAMAALAPALLQRERCPPIGQVLEIAGSGSRVVMDAARAARAAGPWRSVDRHVRPGRQPGEDEGRQQLAGRQRPHPARRRRARHGHRQHRLPR